MPARRSQENTNEEMRDMTPRRIGFATAAILVPAAIAATVAFGQTQPPPSQPPQASPQQTRSPEVRARLLDGRMAMIRESLKLDAGQLKLWEPVEARLRASFAAREQARAERRARRQSGQQAAPPALPDRLDRASKRATDRAERLKALAEAFRPFYAALNDEQKAVASVVLRPAWRGRGFDGPRGHMRRASMPERL
jgi:hypothetical protein